MSDTRLLFGFIRAVCDAHDSPLLAALPGGKWQIVDAFGKPLSEAANTPYRAWQSAAERLKEK